MADDVNTNPFLSDDDDDYTINEEQNVVTTTVSATEHQDINWDSIAAKLLKDKFILTALELHTELVESGRELPRLRDYFSNPGNFERSKEDSPPTTLPRTSSIQTFDSLDFARYSDDGERQVDERVAVLEFELRKAQDTIKSLRASLTREAELVNENEHTKAENPIEGKGCGFSDETIKTMEKKALNFLVNQYLLLINNKLTAVTFSEENEDQDFEDWDDVGLNIPQPPDLLHLYRDYYNRVMPSLASIEIEIQTDLVSEAVTQLEEDVIYLRSALDEKSAKIAKLEELLLHKDKDMLRRRGVAEGSESEPPSTPYSENQSIIFDDIPFTPYSTTDNQTDVGDESDLPLDCDCDHSKNETCSSCVRVQSPEVYRLDFTDEGDHSGDQDTLDSASVDGERDQENKLARKSRMAEKVKENNESVVSDSKVSDNVDGEDVSETSGGFDNPDNQSDNGATDDQSNVTDNVVYSDKHGDNQTAADGDVSNGIVGRRSPSPTPVKTKTQSNNSSQNTDGDKRKQTFLSKPDRLQMSRKMSTAFSKALRDVCFHVPKDNRIILEVSKITDADQQKVVAMLARCLPHIVPNVLLAKREELIPLIICTTMLHPDAKERDNLLNILFNLIKKPDEEQRQLILTGCVAFAQHVGPTRLEAELLPQCWEQISHKYMERRLLVAEACGALAAYLPPEIRSSLVLSMLQQMLQDDKEADVREAVVRSLGLIIGFISDRDKYPQGTDLLKTALRDSSEKVVTSAKEIFLPSFAMWAYELGKLEHSLLHSLLRDLEDLVKDSPHGPASVSAQRSPGGMAPVNEGRFLLYVTTLTELVPFLYVSVLESGPYTEKFDDIQLQSEDLDSVRFPKSSSVLTDLITIVGNKKHLVTLLKLFEGHINQEWFEPWDTLNWVVNNLIPRLLEVVMGSALSFPRIVSCLGKCFYRISVTFGKTFVDKKIKPRFIDVLLMNEEHIDPSNSFTSNSTPLTTCVVPVYASGVLSAFNTEEDRLQLSQFLREALFCLSIYKSPKDSLRITLAELCTSPDNHELLVNVLWEGVVHPVAQVRGTAARMFDILLRSVSELLASTRIVPALVTLGSDPEMEVRMATIPALGTIIETISTREILEKVYMQLQAFLDDPMYREAHDLHLELVAMFARIGPNAEQKFRDEFMLPRLTVITLEATHLQNEAKKKEMALLLFEAYSALSCCFINYQLVQEAMLPGLRCLKQEMTSIAPEHEEVINSMIKEYESKVETTRPADRSSSFTGSFAATGDDMKARMMSRLKESTSKASNISSLFNRKK